MALRKYSYVGPKDSTVHTNGFVIPRGNGETDVADGSGHPFKVTADGNIARVRMGSVCNVVLSNSYSTKGFGGGIYSVWIKVSCSGGTYPSGVTWNLASGSSSTPQNTEDNAYVKIAQIDNGVVIQLVMNSLWSDRLKYGTGSTSVRYYFNTI